MNSDELVAQAQALDSSDELANFREEFHIPKTKDDQEEIYFVGNSLGLQPKQTHQFVAAELDSWKTRGVRGHFEGEFPWMPYHEFLTQPMAELVGGNPTEVVMMNSLTANLHLMMATFYRPHDRRTKILIEDHAFPSDHFAVESQIRWHDYDPDNELVTLSPHEGQELLETEKIVQAIDYYQDRLAMILLPGVQYYTGQFLDLPEITTAAHRYKIPVGFDLAHAAGNVPLRLHDWEVDFAVWCSYKYLNSGPGSVAGCFIHEKHATNTSLNRLAGWWGDNKSNRFQMDNSFDAIPTAEGWQLSNPPILSLAAIRSSLDIFSRAGFSKLIEKSHRLTEFFEFCLKTILPDQVKIITPNDPHSRGCQLSLQIKLRDQPGKEVHQKLEDSGVRTDWREPDVIRAAPVPLYNQFAEAVEFCLRLKRILDEN